MKEIINRLIEWFNGGKAAPYELNLFPTNKCNLKCLSCVARGRPGYKPSEELPKEKYLEIIKDAGNIGIKCCNISGGGEPLSRFETTMFIMREIKKQNIVGRLITNGTLFTSKAIKELVEIGWYEVQFSIHGPNDKIDDYLRGKVGAFQKSTKAMESFKYWKKRLKKKIPRIIITTVVSSKNYDKIPEMVKLAHDVEAAAIIIQPLSVPSNEIGKKLRLNEKQQIQFSNYLRKEKNLAEKYKLEHNFHYFDSKIMEKSSEIPEVIKFDVKNIPQNDVRSIPCFLPWLNMCIRADGKVGSCGGFFTEDINQKTLEETWYSNSFNDFRKKLLAGEIPPCCMQCCGINTVNTRKIRKELSKIMKIESKISNEN